MLEAQALGMYVPSAFQPDIIESEIRAYLPPCCKRERISVRVPPAERLLPNIDNLHWHQDGGGAEGTTHHMVVWASANPTEIQLSAGQVCVFAPFQVIWYNNYQVRHRWPVMGAINPNRWFVSVRCSGAME